MFCFTLVFPPPLPQEVGEATLLFHTIPDDRRDSGAVLRKPSGDGDNDGESNNELPRGGDDVGADVLEQNDDSAAIDRDYDGYEDGLPAADGNVPPPLIVSCDL